MTRDLANDMLRDLYETMYEKSQEDNITAEELTRVSEGCMKAYILLDQAGYFEPGGKRPTDPDNGLKN